MKFRLCDSARITSQNANAIPEPFVLPRDSKKFSLDGFFNTTNRGEFGSDLLGRLWHRSELGAPCRPPCYGYSLNTSKPFTKVGGDVDPGLHRDDIRLPVRHEYISSTRGRLWRPNQLGHAWTNPPPTYTQLRTS